MKKNEDDSQRRLQNTKFERTSLRILKCKPTNVLKDSTKSLCIDTDTGNWKRGEPEVNPISREVLFG